MGSKKYDLGSERPDLGSERPDMGSKRRHLGFEKPDGMAPEEQMTYDCDYDV